MAKIVFTHTAAALLLTVAIFCATTQLPRKWRGTWFSRRARQHAPGVFSDQSPCEERHERNDAIGVTIGGVGDLDAAKARACLTHRKRTPREWRKHAVATKSTWSGDARRNARGGTVTARVTPTAREHSQRMVAFDSGHDNEHVETNTN